MVVAASDVGEGGPGFVLRPQKVLLDMVKSQDNQGGVKALDPSLFTNRSLCCTVPCGGLLG